MEVFEIFIIRYINYINIWSIELTSENFYEEFKDGILLVNLLKQWSSLYGYNNTEGDLIIYKRPLSRSQALVNINLCINFIVNPPEKSKLPEYINREKELIKAELIYEMEETSVIQFISNIFHHYLIPYLRVNSKYILDNVNKYLMLHGLSLSDETMQNFYKMIIKDNARQLKDEVFLERIESWEQYMSLSMKEMEEQEERRDYLARFNDEDEENNSTDTYDYNYVRMKKTNEKKSSGRRMFEPKYINSLQCDITSNGFMLIMVMLYQMGWIDTAILCQMYYVPKTQEEFKWNHEIVYYSFQTINNYLNIQKELSIINHSSSRKCESIFLDDESDHQVADDLMNSEIPFILLPLSSLYMENFSPYVLLLQIEILYNLLTQQIDSNYDVTSLSLSHLAVYGPYQPINLELLDELTYRDNYPLNWTMSKCSNLLNPGNTLEIVENQEECGVELGEDELEDMNLGLNKENCRNDYVDYNSLIVDDNLSRMERLFGDSNLNSNSSIREEGKMNNIKQDEHGDDDDYVVGSMYEYLQDKEKEIHNEARIGDLYQEEMEYDIGYVDYKSDNGKSGESRLHGSVINKQDGGVEIEIQENNIKNSKCVNVGVESDHHRLFHLQSKGEQLVGSEIDEMFTGLEKELEILKIYDKSSCNGNDRVNESAGNSIVKTFKEKMTTGSNCGTRELRDRFSQMLTKEGSDQSKIKPLVSRTALEEHQKKILEMAKNDDEYASKVFDITRKQSDGVIEKISTAISENNRLLEKLKMSMNLQKGVSSHHEESKVQVSNVNDEKRKIDGLRDISVGLGQSKENISEINNGASVGGGFDLSFSQKVEGVQESLLSADLEVDTRDNLKAVAPKKSLQKVSRRKKVNKVSFSDLVQMEVERAGLKSC